MSLLRSCSFFILLSGLYLVSSRCYKSTAAQLEEELRDLYEIPLHNLSTYDSDDILKWNCSDHKNPNLVNKNQSPNEKEAKSLETQVAFADSPASSNIVNTSSTGNPFKPNTYVAIYRKIFDSQTDEMFAPSSNIPVAVVANVSLKTNTSASPNVYLPSPTQHPQTLEIDVTESDKDISESVSLKNISLDHDKDSLQYMSHYTPVCILLGEKHGITFLNATYPGDSIYINKTDFDVFSVDFKFATKEIYFAANKGIRITGKSGFMTAGVDGPVSLAVDWVHDRLYWMSVNHQTVEAADLDGNNRTLLVDAITGVKYPNNIAVDPYAGFLFFVANNTIYRSNLHGRSLVTIDPLGNTSKTVRCLTLDVKSRRIFFSGKLKAPRKVYIASSDYEGESVRFHDIGGTDWTDIYSLSVFRDGLYFAHYSPRLPGSVWSVNTSWVGKRPVKVYDAHASRGGIWSIKVHDAEVQKESDKVEEKNK